jgi:transcriptional regulator with XRE-family HTH domain
MNLAEIQSFKQIGRRLRSEREGRGLTLPAVAGLCGMSISELVRIENGELLGFRQVLEDALTNAEVYAKALDVELGGVERQRRQRVNAARHGTTSVFRRFCPALRAGT